MQHVNDIAQSLQEKRHLALIKSPVDGEAVPPTQPKPELGRVCPTCKCELNKPGDHGWVHGGYDETNHRTIVKPCPTCSGGKREAALSSRQADLVGRLFGGSQIPYRARNWTFDTYPADGDQSAKDEVVDFVARHMAGDVDSQRGLYLGGSTGRCKTGLAISALKAVMETGQLGLFVMTSDLMDRLRATFSKGTSETEDELIQAVTTVPWLVLDDLGVEKPTEYVIMRFYTIIEKRRSKGLYTILTSNMSTTDLEKYWRPDNVPAGGFHPGVRVVERIREDCQGVSMHGRNQRQRGVQP